MSVREPGSLSRANIRSRSPSKRLEVNEVEEDGVSTSWLENL